MKTLTSAKIEKLEYKYSIGSDKYPGTDPGPDPGMVSITFLLVNSDHETRLLASDWLIVVLAPGYWPLIG